MPAIKHQQRNACPEISLGEIHIPDDADLGTGTFTNTFSPRALPPTKVISSIMINAPSFQVAATVNPNSEITVAGDVPCAVETQRQLGSRLRNHL